MHKPCRCRGPHQLLKRPARLSSRPSQLGLAIRYRQTALRRAQHRVEHVLNMERTANCRHRIWVADGTSGDDREEVAQVPARIGCLARVCRCQVEFLEDLALRRASLVKLTA